jgi:hypothetical protein
MDEQDYAPWAQQAAARLERLVRIREMIKDLETQTMSNRYPRTIRR